MPGLGQGTVGANGPIEPFKFFVPQEPQSQPPTVIDDGSDGWDGLASTFGQTAVAIAASLALTVSMTAAAQQPYIQDELPQQATVVDDIQWQNPTFPIAPSWNIQQFFVDTDYIPQISVDEQYRVEPVQPVVFGSDWTTPLIFTDPDYPPQIGVDESPWQNPVQPFSPAWNQQVTFYDSDPLPSLVDEVYWFDSTPLNQPSWNIQLSQPDIDYVPPPAATVVDEIYALPLPSSVLGSDWTKPLPQVDADYIPQISVDEQYWQNPVSPVPPQANLQSPVPLDADYLPQITVDDIPWVNPVPPVIAGTDWNKQPPVGPDADYIPQIGVDEQYWINPVKPQVPGADWTYQPPPVEDDYLPSLSIDDTPWVNPVAPVAPQWNVQPPTAPDADYIPQIAVSDDVWTVPVPQGSTWNIQPQIIDSDFAPPAATIVDEIYWQNPVGPWPQQANIQLVIVDEQIVSQPAVVDEVYWANPTPPWIINNIPLQQWMFDDGGLPIAPSVTTTFVVWLNDD
jgi:hypothetical protein